MHFFYSHYKKILLILLIITPIILISKKFNTLGQNTFDITISFTNTKTPPLQLNKRTESTFDITFLSMQRTMTNLQGMYFYPVFDKVDLNIIAAQLTYNTCLFTLKEGKSIRRYEDYIFLEKQHCGLPVTAETRLSITTSDDLPKLQIRARQSTDKSLFLYSQKLNSLTYLVPQIKTSFITDKPQKTKYELLKYMWKMDERFILTILLFGAAALYLLSSFLLTQGIQSKNPNNRKLPIACALIFLSIGIVFSVITPPFQAPDEPDHFLGYSKAVNATSFISKSKDLAEHGHFGRIRHQIFEHFKINDVDRNENRGWANKGTTRITAVNVEQRSLTTYYYWKFFKRIIPNNLLIHEEILALRLWNILFVSIFFTWFCFAIFKNFVSPTWKIFSVFGFLYMTALPFFSMAISNYPVMIGLFLAMLGTLSLKTTITKKHIVKTIMFSVLISLFLSSGKIAVFSLPFLTFAFAFTQPRFNTFKSFFLLVIFNIIVIFSLLSILPLPTEIPLQRISNLLGFEVTNLALNLFCSIGFWIIPCLYALISMKQRTRFKTLIPKSHYIIYAVILIIFSLPLIFGPIELIDIELGKRNLIEPWRYASNALYLFFFGASPNITDIFMQKAFWVGFGWLDANIHKDVFNPIKLLPFIAMLIMLWHALKENSDKIYTVTWLCAAIAIGLGTQAIASYYSNINLHGRYIIPMFLAYYSLPVFFSLKIEPKPKYIILSIIYSILLLTLYTSLILSLIKRYWG